MQEPMDETRARYLRNLWQQRQRLNQLKQRERYLQRILDTVWEEMHRLRSHADKCCTCGSTSHAFPYGRSTR